MATEAPKRIQRRRTKGWRMPEGAVCVTRPSVFGNPFTVAAARDADYRGTDEELRLWCIDLFRQWVTKGEFWEGPEAEKRRSELLRRLPELRGKHLACFCPDGRPCHADILLELANA